MMDFPYDHVSGMIAAGYIVVGLFFLRFWRRTRDGLFLAFAFAFALLAVNQVVAALVDLGRDERGWVWLLRLAAFVLIIVAVARKNMSAAR